MLRFGIFLALAVLGCFLPKLASYPAAVSPLVGAATLLGGQVTLASLVALLLAAPCTVKRRFFCRKVCPLGFCFNVIGKLQRKMLPNRLPRFMRNFPPVGVFLVLWTLLGSAIGVAGFLWLDPLVLFESPFRGGVWLLPFLGIILLSAWFAPTFWCRKFCPLGGTQDILYAPKTLIAKPKAPHPNLPVRLGPLPKGEGTVCVERRRKLLRLGVLTVLFGGMFEFRRRQTTANSPMRPPGALPEPFFLALCSRCGTCSQVCPTKLLKAYTKDTSALDWGMPRLQYDPAWCRDDCTACTQSCPSGALRRIPPDEKKNAKIGLAVFEFEFCRLYEDIECSICGRDCPFEAISYEWSEKEYRRIVKIDAEICTGCGRCIVSCPAKGTERPLNVVPFPHTFQLKVAAVDFSEAGRGEYRETTLRQQKTTSVAEG